MSSCEFFERRPPVCLNSVCLAGGQLAGRRGVAVGALLGAVLGTVAAAAHRGVRTPLEEPIEDRLRRVTIMHHVTQGRQGFVRGQQHRATHASWAISASAAVKRVSGPCWTAGQAMAITKWVFTGPRKSALRPSAEHLAPRRSLEGEV